MELAQHHVCWLPLYATYLRFPDHLITDICDCVRERVIGVSSVTTPNGDTITIVLNFV
jgi:hypothetical protein